MQRHIAVLFSTRSRCALRRLCACAKSLPALCLALVALLLGGRSLFADEANAYAGIFLESGHPNRTHLQGPFSTLYYENAIVGATRFYNEGYTGTRSVMANIEAGYIWNGHETLGHVGLIPTSGTALGQVDRHATWVAGVMGGRPGGANPGPYQQGIAPDAQLFAGAIARSWSGTRWTGGFSLLVSGPSAIATYGPYRAAFLTGLNAQGGPRTADVINSSWSGSVSGFGATGNDNLAGTIDALAASGPRTLHVVAAGNTGAGPNQVGPPGSGFNRITVAALAPNGGAFNTPSAFSSGGPSDYSDPNQFVSGGRQPVDIAAPGQNFSTAYYGGQTGGAAPHLSNPSGGYNDPAGGPDWYTHSVNGTSFAAPTVAGAAALLYDSAYDRFASNPNARDARVIKAVLMNSADKTLNWNNGQSAHPNGNGGVLTTRGLDNRVGTGRLNLDRAYDQFLGGTTDVAGTASGALGSVNSLGWDFGLVHQGMTNDYSIRRQLVAGTDFTATLTWFRDRQQSGTVAYLDASYDNLDLELWDAVNGTATQLVSASQSRYNNSEHFHFTIPTTGEYLLRVRWTEELFHATGITNSSELYGLAWSGVSIPEPASLLILLSGAAISFFAIRRRPVGSRL